MHSVCPCSKCVTHVKPMSPSWACIYPYYVHPMKSCKNHAHHSLVPSYCHIHPLCRSATGSIQYNTMMTIDDILQSKRESISGVFNLSVQESYHLRASGIHIADRSMESTNHVPNELGSILLSTSNK